MIDQTKLTAIGNWLIAGAQPPKSIEAITEDCARRLNAAGVPLDLMIVNGLFIHPNIRGIQIRWSKTRGVRRETFRHAYFNTGDFNETPIAQSITTKRTIRLDMRPDALGSRDITDYDRALSGAGYTDILVLPLINLDGSVSGCIEFGTKSPGGFSGDAVTALRRVQSPWARVKEYFTERFDKQITLATYIGEDTSRKVLSGQIVRGQGETISAVVLFADIKGFTTLSNQTNATEVLNVLNRFFSVIDNAVVESDGEILKFIGDGVLVIFPAPDDLMAQEAAAEQALTALSAARNALADDPATPRIAFRAALHVGDLFFGNIGSRNRLDFTAIGPAVNLCSRMLAEASSRDVDTVCSAEFLDIAVGSTGTAVAGDFGGFDGPVTFFVLG